MNTEKDDLPVDEKDDDIMVTIELDNGESLDCEILSIFAVGEHDYIVLLPVDEHGTPLSEDEVFIYRYMEDEQRTPILDNIQSDEEYKLVAARFDELQNEAIDCEEE